MHGMRLRELLRVQEGTISARRDPLGEPPRAGAPEPERPFSRGEVEDPEEDDDEFLDDALDALIDDEDDEVAVVADAPLERAGDEIEAPVVAAPVPVESLPAPPAPPGQPRRSALGAAGIVSPRFVIVEARRAGLPLPLACALLEKESGGGANIFGREPTIFAGAGKVTREKYAEYKRRRIASGNRLMQGVGPCQLTWWEVQDEADREGGCWRPQVNIRVGFRHLAQAIAQHGMAGGVRRYYRRRPTATQDASDLLARAKAWRRRLAEPTAPTVPSGSELEKLSAALARTEAKLQSLIELEERAGRGKS
jgi:hypothetical protein